MTPVLITPYNALPKMGDDMNMRLFTLCAVALAASAGYETQAAPAEDVRPAIEAANAQFAAAVAQHDGAALAALTLRGAKC